jgi:homoserine kinase type II
MAAIAYEHGVLSQAGATGWPVAAAISTSSGNLVVELTGQRYALFPFLPGRPAPYNSVRYLRVKGALLARLHVDLASITVEGQREGYRRVWELDDPEGDLFSTLLREFAAREPVDAAVFRRYRYRSLRELARLGYGELRDRIVHWDFHHDNLLFDHGELTALLDFDSVHRDARVADVAQSILLDCLEPPAHNTISPPGMAAFLAGYQQIAPLSSDERELIVPMLPALVLARSADNLRAYVRQGDERALRSLYRAARFRLPAMDRQAVELRAVTKEATP